MGRAEPPDGTASSLGVELAHQVRRRLVWAAVIANGLGGVAVFFLAILAPSSPEPGDVGHIVVINGVAFVVFMVVAFPFGLREGGRIAEPLDDWLQSGLPADGDQQDQALRLTGRLTLSSVRIWLAGAVFFAVVNGTYSLELGLSAALATLLGGTTCCALLYLLAERATRPGVARALAGRAPPRMRGPSVAARLTMAWTLATGVPLFGIAAILVADLAGARIDTAATVSMLLLALAGLGVGLAATVLAARSVGDPVRSVQEAMASVEEGDFDARVHVEDGSEIGQLQAGFNRMAGGLAERERLRDIFGRHVGRDVAEAAVQGELTLGGEEREVAVLFVDLIGSTALAARRPPAEVVALLNTFFHVVVEVAEGHGGWVNKFEGDAALCVFGAPIERDDSAGDALSAARRAPRADRVGVDRDRRGRRRLRGAGGGGERGSRAPLRVHRHRRPGQRGRAPVRARQEHR